MVDFGPSSRSVINQMTHVYPAEMMVIRVKIAVFRHMMICSMLRWNVLPSCWICQWSRTLCFWLFRHESGGSTFFPRNVCTSLSNNTVLVTAVRTSEVVMLCCVKRVPRMAETRNTGIVFCRKIFWYHRSGDEGVGCCRGKYSVLTSVSQPPGPGINYTWPREAW